MTVLFPVLQALEPLEQAVALSVVAVKQSEQVAVSVPFEQKSAVQKQIPRYFYGSKGIFNSIKHTHTYPIVKRLGNIGYIDTCCL